MFFKKKKTDSEKPKEELQPILPKKKSTPIDDIPDEVLAKAIKSMLKNRP